MANRYWVGGSGTWNSSSTTNWSATSGGAGGASVPTASDSVFFDQNSTYTVTLSGTNLVCLDMTVSAGTVTFTASATASISIHGNLSTSAATTFNNTNLITLVMAATSGTKTITTNGIASFPILDINGVGGTFQLQDALTQPTGITARFTNGTLDLNGKTLTAGFCATATGTKNITFNGGTIVVLGNFSNAAPTGFTTTAGTGSGKISMVRANNTKTFALAGSTFNCTVSNDGATRLLVTQTSTTDNGVIENLTNGVQPTEFAFTRAKTFNINNWNVSGTAGNLVTITGALTSATPFTLSKSSGIVSADYLDISYSTATGGAEWYAGANSVDSGNNTGWIFSAAPSPSGNFFMLFS